MSINKLVTLSLASVFFIILLQISNAGGKTVLKTNHIKYNSIVNIVDPASIVGTEVLIEDLL